MAPVAVIASRLKATWAWESRAAGGFTATARTAT